MPEGFEITPEMIPEDLRSEPTLANVKDIPTLVKNYVNAEKLIGRNRIALPGENATEEELNQFYTTLGRPETPDKYDFKIAEDAPIKPDEGTVKWIRDTFHKYGIPKSAAEKIWNDYTTFMGSENERIKLELSQSAEQNIADLKKEYGNAFDQRIEAAKRAIAQFGGKELSDFIANANLGNYIPLVKAFADVGMKLMEDGMPGRGRSGFEFTPGEAQVEITALQANKEFMVSYMNKNDPNHAPAVERMQRLFAAAYPEPKEDAK